MNERIIELAEKASDDIGMIGYHNIPDKYKEKFAELIVQECIGIIEDISPAYNDYRDAIEDAFRIYCMAKIKQHFGVE